uniref:Lissencephaly-1 homolog n=1 Tax=Guillardia theta TaxID=55529 RepID=A0A6U6B6P7_GUITH|mmetsp:Transcript_36255/g.113166  ORF Transcript_36255/g.113166 Transcript_36255/m.113166 type:complete len:443 (+) Transcript_36255:323-1651(+)
MVLTPKQKAELHAAIADYLSTAGYTSALKAFIDDAGLDKESVASIDPKDAGLLEKKWTSVVRLQKRVMELEGQVASLQSELKSADPGGARRKVEQGRQIPRAPHVKTLTGHRSPLSRVIFHPVFADVITCSEDASIKLWDLDSGRLSSTLKGHTASVNDVSLNSDGTVLASGSSDLSVKLWKLGDSNECLRTLRGHEHSVSGVAWINSDELVISASRDTTIKVWEAKSGYCVKTLTGHSEWVRRIITSSVRPLCFSCSSDKTVKVWDVNQGSPSIRELRGHEHVIECLALSNEKASLILMRHMTKTGSEEWAASTEGAAGQGENSVAEGRGGGARSLLGAFIASGSRDKSIRIWHVESGKCILVLQGHDNWVRDVCFHPNGLFLLSVSDDRSLRVWDLEQARCLKTLADAHDHFVSCLAIDPQGSLLATGSVDSAVRVWECV